MKRLTIERLEHAVRDVPTAVTTLTAFQVPVIPDADWPLLPSLEHVAGEAVECAILAALDAGLSLGETLESARVSLAAFGASLPHDDLLTLVTAVGLERT